MISPQSTSPIPTALPKLPPRDFFTDAQWDILFALVDGVLPSITPQSAASKSDATTQIQLPDKEYQDVIDKALGSLAPPASSDNIRALLEHRPARDESFRQNLIRTVAFSPPSQQRRLGGVLSLIA